ncbi:hypothetical protein ACIRU3_47355 [Streptomyces sp. NPDC101151]|uniref:hypothetical protein n=1 Tax=Streptomyces sp. NPDC101151 TaxID=3366115 RepID=UPI00380ACB42
MDDALKDSPELARWRPAVGIASTLSDAELVTLVVMSTLLGYASKRRRLRRARQDFPHLFPYLSQQSGYTSVWVPRPLRGLVNAISKISRNRDYLPGAKLQATVRAT